MGSYLWTINLNVNGLNAPTKKKKTGSIDTKTKPLYMLSTRDPPQNKGHITGWKWRSGKIFHTNGDQKKVGVAILILDKIDFEIKAMKRDKEGRYIMIKGSIHEEDITIINTYASNIGAPQYVRQTLTSMKG